MDDGDPLADLRARGLVALIKLIFAEQGWRSRGSRGSVRFYRDPCLTL